MRQPLISISGLSLAVALAGGSGSGCSPEETCFGDAECGNGMICRQNKCVKGSRGGDGVANDDGAVSDFDWPQPGDPINTDYGPPADPAPLGPTVTILSPLPYELIQNLFTISAQILDVDGVAPGEVMAIIAERFFVPMYPAVGPPENMYQAGFDARQIPYMAFPALVVTAKDIYGNEGHDGLEFTLDRESPIVALDSPDMVYYQTGLTGLKECSEPFNPLGPYRVRHGDVINPLSYFWGVGFFPRARIEDRANDEYLRTGVPYSGVDNDSVYLYLLDSDGLAAGHKLFLGDGPGLRCNRLDPSMLPDAVAPATDQAIVQRLVPVGRPGVCPQLPYPYPWGAPDFSQQLLLPPEPGCDTYGVDLRCSDLMNTQCYQPPPAVCATTEGQKMSIWIGADGAIPSSCRDRIPPAVYVLNEYNEDWTVTCTGGPFDALNHTSDGPACIGAVAADNFGNKGFSPPIVICIDRFNSGVCAGFGSNPPDPFALCTNGCTARGFLPDQNLPPGLFRQYRFWPYRLPYGG